MATPGQNNRDIGSSHYTGSECVKGTFPPIPDTAASISIHGGG